MPASHLTRPFLFPGRLGHRQVLRRAHEWLHKTLPKLLEARRAAVISSVTDTLRDAEQHFHQHVARVVEQEIADAATTAVDRGDDIAAAMLRQLRSQLREEGDAC